MRRVKLEDVTSFVRNGKSIKNSRDNFGIPITRIETISDGSFNPEKLGYGVIKNLDKIGDYWLQDGDILMSHINSPKHLGKSAIYKHNGLNVIHGMNLLCIRAKKEIVLAEYLNYFFSSKYFYRFIESISNQSVNQASFSASKLKNLEIWLPSLDDQEAIVTKLDLAQRLIDIDREMLAKYDELIQSIFMDMFGESTNGNIPLSDLVEINPRKSEISDHDKSLPVSFVGMADVGENGSLNLSRESTIHECWNGYTYFKEGDVLFAKITPCMENGKGAIAIGLENKIGFGSTEFHVLRPKKDITKATWIYYLSYSERFRKVAESFMTGSAGQKRVPSYFFEQFKVNNPPIHKQDEFEDIVNSIKNIKKKIEFSLNKSKELLSSLMNNAFSYYQ